MFFILSLFCFCSIIHKVSYVFVVMVVVHSFFSSFFSLNFWCYSTILYTFSSNSYLADILSVIQTDVFSSLAGKCLTNKKQPNDNDDDTNKIGSLHKFNIIHPKIRFQHQLAFSTAFTHSLVSSSSQNALVAQFYSLAQIELKPPRTDTIDFVQCFRLSFNINKTTIISCVLLQNTQQWYSLLCDIFFSSGLLLELCERTKDALL